MPIKSAARRASCASSAEQQPRAPERNDCGFFDSAKCTPVTSWPASTARAAATAESTPPDIAARTFIDHLPCRLPAKRPGNSTPELRATVSRGRRAEEGRKRKVSGKGSSDAGARRGIRQGGGKGIDVRSGRGVAEREPN